MTVAIGLPERTMCSLMNATSCHQQQSQVLPLHVHWHGKDTAPPGVHLMIGVFITVVGVVAIIGNSLVVLTCIRFKDLRTRSNLLILNLAVGDLLMCSIDFPLLAVASFFHYWPFGTQVCHLYAFLTAVAGMVTINSLAAISVDRYWAVVWRSSPGQQLPKCIIGIIVVCVWSYSTAWAMCPLFGWGSYVLDGIQTTCTFDYLTRSWTNRSFVIAISFSNFVLPFFIMIFSYARIWITIREIKTGLEKQASLVSVGSSIFSHKNSRHPSVDQRYSNLSIKSDYASPTKTSKNPAENEVPVDVGCQLDGSLRTQERKGDVTLSISPLPRHESYVLVKGNDMFRGAIKTIKESKTRTNVQECSYKMHKNVSHFENQVVSDEIHFYKRHYKSLTFKKSRYNGDITKLPDQHDHKSYRSGVDNGYDDQPDSKLYAGDVYPPFANKPSNYLTNNGSTTQSSTSSQRFISRKILEKIRKRYRSVFRQGLFLKQHQYRLHCEQKTMKIIMFLLIAFTVSWFPYMVISLIGLFGDASSINYFTSVLPSLIAKTSMVFNPILYSISHPKVRKRILALFCKQINSSQVHLSRLHHMRSSSTLSNSKT